MNALRPITRDRTVTLPAALVWSGDRPLITLSDVAADDLDAPFLDMALARGTVRGFVPLDEVAMPDAPLPIAGAIFHMTRCGSTLLCRQFGAVERVAALSEPRTFQQLLDRPGIAAPDAVTIRRVRQLAALYGNGLAPVADRVVIKWPGLIGQHGATVARALDGVPMLFLHRDPLEILASIEVEPLGGHRHVRPDHLAPDAGGRATAPRDRLETSARLIARICRTAAGTPGLHALDFADLPAAAWERVAPYFGFDLSDGDVGAMRRVAAFHSKDPARARPFASDRQAKRESSSADARRFAADIVAPALHALLHDLPPLGAPSHAGTLGV